MRIVYHDLYVTSTIIAPMAGISRLMAAYTGEAASVVLGIIIRKIKGATRI